MKAISYLTSSDAKHGKYGSLPNVEIPENTESACPYQFGAPQNLADSIDIPEYHHHQAECYTRGLYEDQRLGSDVHGHHVRVHRLPKWQLEECLLTCCCNQLKSN